MARTPPPLLAPISFLNTRWATHLTFWLVVILVLLTGSVSEFQTKNFWLITVIAIMQLVMYAYFILLVLIPYFFYRSKILLFIVLSLLWAVAWSYVMYYVVLQMMPLLPANIPPPSSALESFSINMLFFFLVTAIKLGKDLLIVQYEAEMAQRQKMQQELNFLRAQLSPHFLLNTMNNLYGLAHEKSDRLPDLMLRLSDLLKYSIYDTKTDIVPVKDEVQYLLDYIELQKIRISESVQLDIQFPANINPKLQIVPLLLVVFVENAFKHSQIVRSGQPRFIRFNLSIDKNMLYFTAENSFERITGSPATAGDKSIAVRNEGIGLESTLRRIELIYGEDSLPEISTTGNVYKVSLILKLTHEKNQVFDR